MRGERYDVLVVGAGLNGLMTAFFLAREGIRRILVVDETTPGHGASTRGDGLLRTYHRSEAEARLAIESLEVYRRFEEIVGGPCGFEESGFLWLVGPADVERLEHDVAAQRDLGATVEILDPPALARLQPHLSLEGVAAAAYEPRSGSVRPSVALSSLVRAVQRAGVTIRVGERVDELTVEGDRIAGVDTGGGRVRASVVVIAAGAWSARVAATAGVTLPVEARRIATGSIFLPPDVERPAAFLDASRRLFFMPEPSGAHVTVGDGAPPTAEVDPDNWEHDVPLALVQEGIRRLSERIPALHDAVPARAWAGVDGFTPDNRGIYDGCEVERLFICAGASQKGLKVAPAVGRAIAQTIVRGSSDVDLSPFALDRFRTSPPTLEPAYANYDDLA